MANYVYSKVICSKEVLENYFIDYDPLGDGKPMEKPYISFNKLFGVKDLNEYHEKYGAYIYYGYGFSWNELPDGLFEIKFRTRWLYPICAIIKAIELSHDTVWYVVEEECVYASKFYWDDGVKEDVQYIDEQFYDWQEKHEGFDETLEYPDDEVWHFLPTATEPWYRWESTDNFARYIDFKSMLASSPPCIEKRSS